LRTTELIHRLAPYHGYPSLSVLLSTHKRRDGYMDDKLRMKKLIADASKQILERLPSRDARALLATLKQTVAQERYDTTFGALLLGNAQARLFSGVLRNGGSVAGCSTKAALPAGCRRGL